MIFDLIVEQCSFHKFAHVMFGIISLFIPELLKINEDLRAFDIATLKIKGIGDLLEIQYHRNLLPRLLLLLLPLHSYLHPINESKTELATF